MGKGTPLTLGSTIMADSGLPFVMANNSLVTDGSSLADSQGLDSVEHTCELPTYPVRWCDFLHQGVSFHEVEHLVSQFREVLPSQHSYTFTMWPLSTSTALLKPVIALVWVMPSFPTSVTTLRWGHACICGSSWCHSLDVLRHLCGCFRQCLQLIHPMAHCL